MTEDKNTLKSLYNQDLKPQLKKLEQDRNHIVVTIIKCITITMITWVVTLAILFVIHEYIGGGIIQGLSIILCGWVFIISLIISTNKIARLWKTYQKEFKANIIQKVIDFIDPKLNYQPKEKISVEIYEKSKIYTRKADEYKGDDLIKGKIGQTDFSFSELHTQHIIRTRKGQYYITIFKGLFFCINFNKSFSGKTFVLTDKAEKVFGRMGTKFQSINTRNEELIRLEDPEFEKEFLVYSSDQVEARYILSPKLMQQCVALKKHKKKEVQFSFVDNYMFITIPYKNNLFEPKLFGSLIDFNFIQDYHHAILSIYEIVNTLQLNTRIWKKEITKEF